MHALSSTWTLVLELPLRNKKTRECIIAISTARQEQVSKACPRRLDLKLRVDSFPFCFREEVSFMVLLRCRCLHHRMKNGRNCYPRLLAIQYAGKRSCLYDAYTQWCTSAHGEFICNLTSSPSDTLLQRKRSTGTHPLNRYSVRYLDWCVYHILWRVS